MSLQKIDHCIADFLQGFQWDQNTSKFTDSLKVDCKFYAEENAIQK